MHVLRTPVVPPARRLAPPKTPPRVIGYLGALTAVKGVARLLEAAPRLRDLGFTIRIAGGGQIRTQLEDAAASGLVEYAGVLHGEEKLRFMESCDLGILPSLWNEPGAPPCSVAEWLASGRPMLVSLRGGLREVVERHPGVLGIEPTPVGIAEAVQALSAPRRFEQLLADLPAAANESSLQAWLDAHQDIYEAAARSPRL